MHCHKNSHNYDYSYLYIYTTSFIILCNKVLGFLYFSKQINETVHSINKLSEASCCIAVKNFALVTFKQFTRNNEKNTKQTTRNIKLHVQELAIPADIIEKIPIELPIGVKAGEQSISVDSLTRIFCRYPRPRPRRRSLLRTSIIYTKASTD